jgi:hypothetical protein
VGYEVESIFGSVRTGPGASDHLGELQAWDLNTGKRVWQHNFKTMLWSLRHTVGARLWRNGLWAYDLEGMYQFSSFGAGNIKRLEGRGRSLSRIRWSVESARQD